MTAKSAVCFAGICGRFLLWGIYCSSILCLLWGYVWITYNFAVERDNSTETSSIRLARKQNELNNFLSYPGGTIHSAFCRWGNGDIVTQRDFVELFLITLSTPLILQQNRKLHV